jgi:hypothetical protein
MAANSNGSVQAVIKLATNGQLTVVNITGATTAITANYTYNVSTFTGASIVNA